MKEYAKILVADDEAMMRNLLLKILESEGYQVTVVSSANEALEKLMAEHYDLLMTDVKMPGMTGFDLLKQVKIEWPEIVVIIMTGYGDAYSVKEALLLGADEYLSKPFKSQEVSLIVERAYWRLLSARNMEKQKNSPQPIPEFSE
jgi:DNA-binding NtrC family response regulator